MGSHEGAMFENAIFNQLRDYGELTYLTKSNYYEVDFVVAPPHDSATGLEVKVHPTAADQSKLNKIAQRHGLRQSFVIGRHATPAFDDFLWGGSIF